MSEELDVVLRELRAVGINKPEIERGKHIHVRWQKGGPVRMVTVSVTGSDWRGRLNVRAEVRRLLRADGAYDEQPRGRLERAINLPKHVEPIPEQLISLRSELADITELLFTVLDNQAQIKSMVMPRQPAVTGPEQPQSQATVAASKSKRQIKYRRGEMLRLIAPVLHPTQGLSGREIAERIAAPVKLVAAHLSRLKAKKLAYNRNGRWFKQALDEPASERKVSEFG